MFKQLQLRCLLLAILCSSCTVFAADSGQLAPERPRYKRAAERYDKAIRGDAAAQYLMGIWHSFLAERNDAMYWLKLAAEQGVPDAQIAYGLLLAEPTETSNGNKKEALRWFMRAAAQGNAQARQLANELQLELKQADN